MFKISEATVADIPFIIEIAEKAWWPAYSAILSAEQIRYMLDTIYTPEKLRSQLLNGNQTYLVLIGDGRHEGFVSFGQTVNDRNDRAAYKIHKLYVRPQNQKKGYGQALIEDIKQRLLQQNIHSVDLNVNRYNTARRFYEKLGFEIIREEDIPIGPYWMNDYVMRLEF